MIPFVSITTYLKAGILLLLVVSLIFIKFLWVSNINLKHKVKELNIEIQIRETNLNLLDGLLKKESKERKIAQNALNELSREVPKIVYSRKLPPSIQKVINGFYGNTSNHIR